MSRAGQSGALCVLTAHVQCSAAGCVRLAVRVQ